MVISPTLNSSLIFLKTSNFRTEDKLEPRRMRHSNRRRGRKLMFIGHFALGFAAKRATPKVSLGLLFVAAQLADLLWPLFVAAGIEQVRIDPGNTAFTPLDFVNYPY